MNFNEKIDYSSLTEYIDCPRSFMFKYVMHMKSIHPKLDLIFGSCWHYGLEVVYIQLMNDPNSLNVYDATEMARLSFNLLWSIEGEPHFTEESSFPKSPGNAANMYFDYFSRYLQKDLKNTILGVETGFAIDLSLLYPGLPLYIGRMDLVMKNEKGRIIIDDHKSSKYITKATSFGYDMSYQTLGYLTAGQLYYDQLALMRYRIAICQVSKIDFHEFEYTKTQNNIDNFLHDLVYHMQNILLDINQFHRDKEIFTKPADMLNCFHRHQGYACTKYFQQCSYFDLCKIRNNPLGWLDKPPQGFIIKEWDPNQHEEEMKRKLQEVM